MAAGKIESFFAAACQNFDLKKIPPNSHRTPPGHTREKKIKSILQNCFSFGPSVVEEEDLEDLHHHGDV